MTDAQIMSMTEVPSGADSGMEQTVDAGEGQENTDATTEQTNEGTVTETQTDQQADDVVVEDQTTEEGEADAEQDPADPEVVTEETTTDPDTAKQLAELFEPFMANGREIKIDSIADAKRLMQMGAGFNKKMSTLKPHLKLIKMLDNNGLLDEGKLSHLIDVSKRDPAAISKLLADSGIDPLNLNVSTDYKPTTYTVDDAELALDDVLADLKGSPHYTQTLDIVVNKWDKQSREALLSNPEDIRILHEQQANGIFDKVMSVVDRERALGKLKGLSDVMAYAQVGAELYAKGEFNKSVITKPVAPAVNTQVQKPADNTQLRSRKLAASPTKAAPGKQKDYGDFDPMTATDAEIMAMSFDKIL